MPSSTSSSEANDRLPRTRPTARLLLAAVVFVLIAAGAELAWRARGFQPSVIDTHDFWSFHRLLARHPRGGRALVITGSSRSQQAIDPRLLEEELPGYDVVHLSIAMTTGLRQAQHLCDDPEFNGVVLLDTSFTHMLRPTLDQEAAPYLNTFNEYYQSLRYANRIANTALKGWIQSKFVALSTELRLDRILHAKGRLRPDETMAYLYMRFDRFRMVDMLERIPPDVRQALYDMRVRDVGWELNNVYPLQPEGVEEWLNTELVPFAERLRARGGQLILLRMPITGGMWERENARFPRELYWDRIEPLTGIRTIHFLDDPVMAQFNCPDGSHLDVSDSPAFTRRLALLLRDVLEDPAPASARENR